MRAVRGHNWTTGNYQLAAVMDGLAWVQWSAFQSQSSKKLRQPKPVDRPDPAAKRLVPVEQQAAAVAYLASLQPPT